MGFISLASCCAKKECHKKAWTYWKGRRAPNLWHPKSILNLANALTALERRGAAMAKFAIALALRPAYLESLLALGLNRQALYGRGVTLLAWAARLEPGRADLHLHAADAAWRASDPSATMTLAAVGFVLDPSALHAIDLMGLARLAQQSANDALRYFGWAAALAPNTFAIWLNRAAAAIEANVPSAATFAAEALALSPTAAVALSNLGLALGRERRFAIAAIALDRALVVDPNLGKAYGSRADVALEDGLSAEAIQPASRAIVLEPAKTSFWLSMGLAVADLEHYDHARQIYRWCLTLDPDFAKASFNLACLDLLHAEFPEAWRAYESRFPAHPPLAQAVKVQAPRWRGEALAGRSILLIAEQGLGDTLQFCRYVPLLAQAGAKVAFRAPKTLHRLLSTLEGVERLLGEDEDDRAADIACPLLSVPDALATTLDTIPSTIPYLSPPPDLAAHWRERLGPKRAFRIGLAWSGNPHHRNDRNRSIALEVLRPLLDLPGIEVHALQNTLSERDVKIAGERLCFHGSALGDWADTAALAQAMDLVISVDTSLAHLAGALGLPTWILLPANPDWRWLLQREDTPWYPRARLYRQSALGSYHDVVARLVQDVAALAS